MQPARMSGSRSNLLAWMCSAALLAVALLVYLLDPVTQRFETWPLLAGMFDSVTPLLPVVDLPFAIRFWLPDFAWAIVTAVFAAEMLDAWGRPARTGETDDESAQPDQPARFGLVTKLLVIAAVILLAACSWELLQGAGLVSGTFDVVDLAVSGLAGLSVIFFAGLCRFVFHDKECR